MNIQNIKIYLQESQNFRREYPQNFNIWKLVKYFPEWQNSLNGNVTPLADERPWLTFSAIEFLEKKLNKDMQIYEYGVGGSTLFFVKRVKQVISVEHDANWLLQVSEILRKKECHNWQGYCIKPTSDILYKKNDISDPYSYISADERFAGSSFKEYVMSIDKYPDRYFDLVLIDGRARPSCLNHAIKKIKKYGFIILDNAERSYYSYIHQSLNNNNWIKYDFYGPGPYVNCFWQTSIWQNVKT